eukprot:CAMPEP_0197174308 /NCGR_PEP_ID=MMETSP1423-20130617/884_1 /TAXON_ID=476441 /ORGANISM="Pseudo-nitzschia heimii, Strain UNC1101" /LENGTH=493 /DNA_ID=CAMNT_0042623219 /DNA_START=178 /DNA_END=1659 /DNA_ORIENTATION=-
MRFISKALVFLCLTSVATCASSSSIVAECNTRLPMSLSTVISDLEAEGVSRVAPACFLSSRGVTEMKKAEIFGIDDSTTTAFGTESGVCMALSTGSCSVPEAASTAVACEGNIVYYADENDLARGEGLFDSLGPAIERILNEDDGIITDSFSLIVVTANAQTTKPRLEAAAVDVLANLVSTKKKVSVLSDVFERVEYVQNADDAMNLLEAYKDPAKAQESIASTVASDFWQSAASSPAAFISSSSNMSPKDIAAARKLGPAARKALDTAVETIKTLTEDNRSIVTEFGDLCGAATKRAFEELEEAAISSAVSSSAVGKQIKANLRDELEGELADLARGQLDLLQEACFADFKAKLSKLRISPILATDMENVVKESVVDFVKKVKSMPVAKADAKSIYQSRLQDFCSERLLAARAGGQFKPVPRKGVSVGLHWLLPKPFGNDYRQEPWMVQATDNLVYIPPDKITDVSPEDVAAGDWRSKIVPSPTGNEMIYMQ